MPVDDLALDVVVRSEAKLARNVENYPYPGSMDAAQEAEILERALALAEGGRYALLPLQALPPVRRALTAEERLLPARALKSEDESAAVALDRESGVSVMINGEDHLSFLAVRPGLCPLEAKARVEAAADAFAAQYRYAYDAQFGFLAPALADVGTGLRVTVTLHLPALEKAGGAENAVKECAAGHIAWAKMPLGSVYLIFNSATIGMTEDEIALSVQAAAKKLIERERGEREKALMAQPWAIDEEMRCLKEMLASDDSLSEKDCMLNWSFLRQAVTAGALHRTLAEVDALLPQSSPGHIDTAAGAPLSAQERGARRLDIFRNFIGTQAVPERI